MIAVLNLHIGDIEVLGPERGGRFNVNPGNDGDYLAVEVAWLVFLDNGAQYLGSARGPLYVIVVNLVGCFHHQANRLVVRFPAGVDKDIRAYQTAALVRSYNAGQAGGAGDPTDFPLWD